MTDHRHPPTAFHARAAACVGEVQVEDYLGAGSDFADGSLDVSNGGDIVFVVSRDNAALNTVTRALWIAPLGLSPRAVFEFPDSKSRSPSPTVKIAPHGRKVALSAPECDGKLALWVADLSADGSAIPVKVDLPAPPSTFAWDATGNGLYVALPQPAPETPNSWLAPDFWSFGLTFLEAPSSRLLHVDLASSAVREIDIGDLVIMSIVSSAWTDVVALVASTPDELVKQYWSVYILTPTGTTPRRVQPLGRFNWAPRFSPDGETLFYIADSQVMVCSRPFDAPRPVAGTPRAMTQYGVLPDGRSLVGVRIGNVALDLALVDTSTGLQRTLIDGGAEGIHHFAISPNGAYVAFARSSAVSLPSITRMCLPGFQSAVIHTFSRPTNAMRDLRTERVTWTSPNGYEAAGILVRPRDDELLPKRPVLICVQGGPDPVLPFSGLGAALQFPLLAFAAAGVAVFVPNSAGRGGASETCRDALRAHGWGTASLNDVLSALDMLRDRYGLDGVAGLMGFSFGGMVTAYCVTQTNRFRCASMGDASGPPFHPFDAMHAINSPAGERPMQMYGFDKPHDPERWRHMLTQSPLHSVGNVTTPVLMQNGAESSAVSSIGPWFQSLRFFGVPSELVLYARSGHGLFEPALRRECAIRDIDWFAYWALDENVGWLTERYGAREAQRARNCDR